jgi:uncharacterized protein HemX
MILTQIYNINKFRLVLWITICIGFGVYPNLKGQSDPLSQADQAIDETNQAVQKTEQSVQKLEDQKQKASKFKTFLKDSIPAYTDQFGSYLKQVIERQNRFDYLDEVPKNNTTKRSPKFPQRITNLKAA